MTHATAGSLSFGVLGAGRMGQVFARRLVELGRAVKIAHSRGPESLAQRAAALGAEAASLLDVIRTSEVVFLAIPTNAMTALPRGAFAAAAGTIVIDVSNYHPELRDGPIEAIDRGKAESQWVSEQIGRTVVKAFNSILAESLLEKATPTGVAGRVALPVAGDVPAEVEAVLGLVDDFGFDPVAAGRLSDSWRQQPGTPAYCRDLDRAQLQRALAEAERDRSARYRREREAELRRLMAAPTPLGSPS